MITIFRYKCEYCGTKDLTTEQEYCHKCGVKLFPFEPEGMYKEVSSQDDIKKKNPEMPEIQEKQPEKEIKKEETVSKPQEPRQDQQGQLFLNLSSPSSINGQKGIQIQTGRVRLGDIFLGK